MTNLTGPAPATAMPAPARYVAPAVHSPAPVWDCTVHGCAIDPTLRGPLYIGPGNCGNCGKEM